RRSRSPSRGSATTSAMARSRASWYSNASCSSSVRYRTSTPCERSASANASCSSWALPTHGIASNSSLSLLRGVIRFSSAPGRCSRTVRSRPTSLVTRCSRAVLGCAVLVAVTLRSLGARLPPARVRTALCQDATVIGRNAALPLHLTSATLLRVSAEGVATALVLTVQARTGNAATAGYLQTAMPLRYVLSGPVIGHALDRVGRPRRVAVALAAGYAVGTALLLATAGRSPLVLALLVAAVIGCTEPIVVALTSL